MQANPLEIRVSYLFFDFLTIAATIDLSRFETRISSLRRSRDSRRKTRQVTVTIERDEDAGIRGENSSAPPWQKRIRVYERAGLPDFLTLPARRIVRAEEEAPRPLAGIYS